MIFLSFYLFTILKYSVLFVQTDINKIGNNLMLWLLVLVFVTHYYIKCSIVVERADRIISYLFLYSES